LFDVDWPAELEHSMPFPHHLSASVAANEYAATSGAPGLLCGILTV
jgi:hypothetical protein